MVYMVERGLLRVDRLTRTGKVVLIELLSSGRLGGELAVTDNAPRSATITAITDASVVQVGADSFRAMLAADNRLQAAVLARIVRRLRALTQQFVETSVMDAPGRIAGRLVRLVDIEKSLGRHEVDEAGSIHLRLPINQEELGQWSGLSREGAVKGLATLRSVGIIETGRKRVVIHRYDDLVQRAGDLADFF